MPTTRILLIRPTVPKLTRGRDVILGIIFFVIVRCDFYFISFNLLLTHVQGVIQYGVGVLLPYPPAAQRGREWRRDEEGCGGVTTKARFAADC